MAEWRRAEGRKAEGRSAERHGRRSEDLAALLLRLKFYAVLERRLRTPFGEIDLVARTPSGLVCFVEVKARRDDAQACDALQAKQRARIARAAQHYLASRPALARKGARFDVISLVPGRLPRHLRDAWRLDD